MTQWQSELPATQRESFRERLAGLRADGLLAASLVGSFDGVLEVLSAQEKSEAAVAVHPLGKTGERSKAIGDPGRDMPYTPITPCKLIDTRGLTGTPIVGGAFAASERRSYAVPAGAYAGLPTTGIGAILVSAATSSSSAGGGILSMMNVAETAPVTNIFGTGYASVTTILTSGSAGQFDAQISGVAGVHLLVDVVGYFAPPTAGNGLRVLVSAGLTSEPNVINGSASNSVGNTGGGRLNTDTSLNFEPTSRQMINLFTPTYGMGIQENGHYFRTGV